MRGAVVFGLFVSVALTGCYRSTSADGASSDAGRPAPPRDDAGVEPAPPPPPPPPITDPPPAISGGNLMVTASGSLAVIADAERRAIYFVDLATRAVRQRIELAAGDEPGRTIEDASGDLHVVLRRAGAILDVDGAELRVLGRRPVCPEPRGIDFEPSTGSLHVACAGGELVSLPAAGGAPTRALTLDDDLRDVVASGGRLYVSRFRSAELLTIDASGTVVDRRRPGFVRTSGRLGDIVMLPNVAWRLRAMPDGSVAMLHQRSVSTNIDVETDGYMGSGRCPGGVVEPAISIFGPTGAPRESGSMEFATLMVDLAVSPAGDELYLASASGGGAARMLPGSSVRAIRMSTLESECMAGETIGSEASAVAIEVLSGGRIVALERNPLQIWMDRASGGSVSFPIDGAPVVEVRGHELFHASTPSMVACASCHPEGAEDGHVWDFGATGPRRTQTLLGGILGTEPFHWNGDQASMHEIMRVTFGERMQGAFTDADVSAISAWLEALPSPRGSVADAASVARGRALFQSDEVGCASCHSGAALTSNENEDVGTGRPFQVPSLLGVMHRAPFMHDGCAPTLDAVVAGACTSADAHGRTSHLGGPERADLVAYLRSL